MLKQMHGTAIEERQQVSVNRRPTQHHNSSTRCDGGVLRPVNLVKVSSSSLFSGSPIAASRTDRHAWCGTGERGAEKSLVFECLAQCNSWFHWISYGVVSMAPIRMASSVGGLGAQRSANGCARRAASLRELPFITSVVGRLKLMRCGFVPSYRPHSALSFPQSGLSF